MLYEMLCTLKGDFGVLWLHSSPNKIRYITIILYVKESLNCYVKSKNHITQGILKYIKNRPPYWKMVQDFINKLVLIFLHLGLNKVKQPI